MHRQIITIKYPPLFNTSDAIFGTIIYIKKVTYYIWCNIYLLLAYAIKYINRIIYDKIKLKEHIMLPLHDRIKKIIGVFLKMH